MCTLFLFQNDIRRTLQELDEKEFVSLRLIVHELRNNYVSCVFVDFSSLLRFYNSFQIVILIIESSVGKVVFCDDIN